MTSITNSHLRGVSRPPGFAVTSWLPLLLVIGFAVLWPLISFELHSLTDGGQSYRTAYADPSILTTLKNTVLLALFDLLFAIVVGTILAWSALHLPPRFQTVGAAIPLLPLLIPGIASVIGWIFLLSPSVGYLNSGLRKLLFFLDLREGPLDIYTFGGMVFVSGLLLSSFIYMFVYNGLRNAGAEYEEAAAVSGASPLRILFTVTLPQLRPSLAYGGGIVFMLALGQFSVPILLKGRSKIDVISTKMFTLLDSYPIPFGEIGALGAPLLLAGVLVLLVQKWVIGDVRRYVTVGGKAQNAPHRPAWWAAWVIGFYGLLAVLLPLLALAYTALSPFWTATVRFDRLTLSNFVTVFSDSHLVDAIGTSVYATAITILIVMPLGYGAARILAKRADAPQGVAQILDLLLVLPYAIPATLFGFALLFAYTQPPFLLYGTRTLIVVAYSTAMIPYAARFLTARLLALGAEPWEASAVSGAGPVRTFLFVTIPLVRQAACAAATIIFILLLQEFAISLLVRSANTQVVGSVLYDQYSGGSYPNVAVLALLMVGLTAAGVAVMLAVGGSSVLDKFKGHDPKGHTLKELGK